jgi:intraflagellar transport protein 80
MVVNLQQVILFVELLFLYFDNSFSGGEDGQVRIWARSGMLRSNLVQSGKFFLSLTCFLISSSLATPIFCVCWSADNDAILYCAGKHLVMKPLSPNSKQNSV